MTKLICVVEKSTAFLDYGKEKKKEIKRTSEKVQEKKHHEQPESGYRRYENRQDMIETRFQLIHTKK
mgnify:CR=1 FL=1